MYKEVFKLDANKKSASNEIYGYIKRQMEMHPSFEPCDIMKHCYQAACGAEHMLADVEFARSYLEREYASTPALDIILVEELSKDMGRVNLAAWKHRGYPLELLFDVFVRSASLYENSKERLTEFIGEADRLIEETCDMEKLESWRIFVKRYIAAGMPAVHHSEAYCTSESPAYRIVRMELLRDALNGAGEK